MARVELAPMSAVAPQIGELTLNASSTAAGWTMGRGIVTKMGNLCTISLSGLYGETQGSILLLPVWARPANEWRDTAAGLAVTSNTLYVYASALPLSNGGILVTYPLI